MEVDGGLGAKWEALIHEELPGRVQEEATAER